MGYTHYWESDGFCGAQFVKLARDAATVIEWARNSGTSVQWDSHIDLPPEITPSIIRFNGIGPDGCETFMLGSEPSKFDFCKTRRKPYDTIVVAILILAADLNAGFTWSSDGDEDSGDFDDAGALLEECGLHPY